MHYAHLQPDEVIEVDNIRTTTPGRTILDLAPLLPSPTLGRLIQAADKQKPWLGPTLPELIDCYPRRAGVPKLRDLVREPPKRTRSDHEAHFIAWLESLGVPMPEVNAHLEFGDTHLEGDFVWRRERVIVELDTYETHGDPVAFERDRVRDRIVQAAGWRAVRVTGPGEGVARDLRRLLRARVS